MVERYWDLMSISRAKTGFQETVCALGKERVGLSENHNSHVLNGSGKPVFLFKTPLASVFGGTCTAALITLFIVI
jgi:hypothetical protein